MNSFLAGVLAALAAAFVATGVFFTAAWSRRTEEGEYLLFGLLSLTLAIYTGGIGAFSFYAARGDWASHWQRCADVTTAGGILSIAIGIHFALRFSRVNGERRAMLPVYGATAVYLAVLLGGGWWERVPDELTQATFLGQPILVTPSFPTVIASSFYGLVGAGILTIVGVLGRAYWRGQSDALAALVGSLFLCATATNDAWQGAGRSVGVFLAPFGQLAFAFAVGLTLLGRYGTLSAELVRRQQDLRTRTRELRRSYKELQKAQSELVRKEQLAVVGELAAVIAHEVRNPLAIIANAVAGLRRDEIAPEDRTTLLQIIEEEASRLNRLVSDLLSYARPVSPQRQLLVLRDLMDRTLTLTEGHPAVKVELRVEPDVPAVWGDANLLRQVFDNLIGNAVQAMNGDGNLTVSLKPSSLEDIPGAMVEVSDTGEGMDTQVRSRARTPFFTTRPSGTGLGLAIVDRIVDAHGGTMTLQSRPGEGSTVSVFLPRGSDGPLPPRARVDSLAPDSRKSWS